jgi:hypothetical protein
MKEVAVSIKSLIQPGVQVRVLEAPHWPAIVGVVRTIKTVQTKKFTLTVPAELHRSGVEVESWCDFPLARDYDATTSTFTVGGMKYEVIR